MSNFWFNEDAFQQGPNEGGEEGIANTMFDDFPRRAPSGPSGNFEQPKQTHLQPMPMQNQKNDTGFDGNNFQQFGASAQMQPPNFEKNSPMFANQQEPLQGGMPQNGQPQAHANSPTMDRMKQHDQLSRMRQQVMHQQMLHRQHQQQQLGHDDRLAQLTQDQVPPENFGIANQMNGMGAPQDLNQGPMAGEAPENRAFGSRQNSASAMQPSVSRGSQASNVAGQPQPANQGGSKPSPAQFAQLQHELFQMTLSDFMSRRGTPITQQPVINNKKINLLALQVLGRKIGGMQAVLKNLQVLNQTTSQMTEWSSICHKLGLFEGIDLQNNVKAKQQVEKLLGSCYLQYILPYEQYTLTEEGQKDIQGRRLQFQRQLFMRLQQQMQKLQTPSSTPQSQQAPTPKSASQVLPSDFQNPEPQSIADPGQFHSPEVTNSPQNMMSNTAGASNAANASAPASSLANVGPHFSSSSSQSPQVPQKNPPYSSPQTSKKRTPQSQQKTPNLGAKTLEKPDDLTPNTIRKYVPIRKQQDGYGKMILKGITELGDEIDLTKPVYLFAPELGSLNIHALIMALKSYTPKNPGEVSSALNTLLVTTTDANFHFNLTDAPELLDALVNLGSVLLDQITGQDVANLDYDANLSGKPTGIDDVFQKYVGNDTMKGEDVTYVVDSLTGELIDNEDSDMEVDEVFTPEEVLNELASSANKTPHLTKCQLPDFMASLRKFRDENRYHFSKVQTKGATNEAVFLVDSLITTTMTLRNLSFTDESSTFMSQSPSFKSFIFKTVKSVATNLEAFAFERKRLCLLKDCLLMLDRNANNTELDTLEETFLTFLLLSSFGPDLTGKSGKEAAIPSCTLATYSYLPFAVDCFAKLLVREPKNKALFQAVLSGNINTSAFSHVNGISTSISDEDVSQTSKLAALYLGDKKDEIEKGILYTQCFKLFLSVIPLTMSGVEFTSFILQRSATVLQALFGAKLLIDSISVEDLNEPLARLPFSWLMGNVRPLLYNLAKNTISSITESVKFQRHNAEHKVLSYVGFKSLVVINSLLANAVVLKTALQEQELENAAGLDQEFLKLVDLYRVQPESDFVLNTILASSIDLDVAQEIVRFYELLQRLS